MSDYKVQPLNGLLAKAGSCRELMEAVIPWAEPILADLGEVAPRLFFVTQDGEDGLLTPISERAAWVFGDCGDTSESVMTDLLDALARPSKLQKQVRT
jgi:hypothetical protein